MEMGQNNQKRFKFDYSLTHTVVTPFQCTHVVFTHCTKDVNSVFIFDAATQTTITKVEAKIRKRQRKEIKLVGD